VLRLLADESCDFAVVRSLRGAGFDVLASTDTCDIAAMAHRERPLMAV